MVLSSPDILVGICNYVNRKREEMSLWLCTLKSRLENYEKRLSASLRMSVRRHGRTRLPRDGFS